MSASPASTVRSDDVLIYLQSKPRLKEWLPDLPGLHKLSRTEILDDFEAIQAEMISQAESSHREQIAGYFDNAANHMKVLKDKENRGDKDEKDRKDKKFLKKPAPAVSATSQQGPSSAIVGVPKPEGTPSVFGASPTAIVDPAAAPADSTAPPSRRSRLLQKILSSSKSLDASHFSASQLRMELEQMRNDIIQYEDAITQAKREIEVAKRERAQLETSYNIIREEYRASIENVETCRLDQEKTENELRQRLTRCSQENADLSERINQLRQLEDEFKNKEWKIENLQIELTQAQRHILLLETMCRTTHKPKDDNEFAQNSSQTLASTSPSGSAGASSASPSGSNVTSPSSTPPPNATSPTSAGATSGAAPSPESLQNLLSSIATTEIVPDVQRLLTAVPDLYSLISSFVLNLSRVEKEAILCREKYADSQIKVHEQTRDLQQQQIQLDRLNKQQMDLHSLIRHAELAVLDERTKLDQSGNHIKLVQTQKDDQTIVLNGYEERMKHFQQLLTAADVRADQANSFLSDVQRQLHVYRNGNKQLQTLVHKLHQEIKVLTRERNDAMDELHEKVLRNLSTEQLQQHYSQSSIPHIKDHYTRIAYENNKLHEEKLALLNRIAKMEEKEKKSVDREVMDVEVNTLMKRIDEVNSAHESLQSHQNVMEKEIRDLHILLKEKDDMNRVMEVHHHQKDQMMLEMQEKLIKLMDSQSQPHGGGLNVSHGHMHDDSKVGTPNDVTPSSSPSHDITAAAITAASLIKSESNASILDSKKRKGNFEEDSQGGHEVTHGGAAGSVFTKHQKMDVVDEDISLSNESVPPSVHDVNVKDEQSLQ